MHARVVQKRTVLVIFAASYGHAAGNAFKEAAGSAYTRRIGSALLGNRVQCARLLGAPMRVSLCSRDCLPGLFEWELTAH